MTRGMENVDGFEALYPFLYSGTNPVTHVLDQMRASTVTKIQEIVDLRDRIAEEHGQSLVDCAEDLAKHFNAGARLFSFGNGGSSTDAQAMAELFLNPPE